MFKLVIQDDEGKTTVVPLIRDVITIGRKEGNTIRLTERNVSRNHARIVRNNGEVQIEDLGSYNGIRVNNARIAERVSLRVSDQVQIGDYKLYLKAEGVEQVDDARTMPIERIDNALPTEVMPAMPPGAAPMAAQAPVPAQQPPNRSAVSIADTDPAGRPVATAAQVAAMSQPVGYGKLVCVSSNFAGKEFDLTRPQMIIGRTDENDIVVNHRSISRNHAKVTRDPETGRYTISDLQSSNGVRVNGQDYGKVELRRGDTVDLGHVRLRFVEPGEDFVFARDAVIADVPEAGGRRGLLVAAIFAVLVLGGVGAYFAFKDKDTGQVANPDKTEGSGVGSGSDQVAVVTPDNPDVGSGATNVVTPDAPDAATQVAPPPNDLAGSIAVECKQLALEKNWAEASKCAERLAEHDPKTSKALRTLYKQELENDLSRGKIVEAINKNDLIRARKELADIEETSVFRAEAAKMVEDLQAKITARYRDEALAIKRSGKCDGYDRVLAEAREKGGQPAYQAVLKEKCEKTPVATAEPKDCSDKLLDNTRACKTQFCAKNGTDPRCGGGTATPPPPPPGCDADALKEEGMGFINSGQHAAALARFEASLKCKRDPYVIQLAFMESCSSGNSTKAKQYYKQLTPAQQQKFAQICIRQKVEYQ
jgi:pSer/pThr/pTyr-binding forkhead associated (FHA) protein